MRSLKNIAVQLFSLGLDSTLFLLMTFRKIVLPGRHKKGNLLSTVFTLFLGISERVFLFENTTVKKKLFKHHLIRQGFIIVASLLFLLTSIEWTDAPLQNASFSSLVQTKLPPISSNESAVHFSGHNIKVSPAFTTSNIKGWPATPFHYTHRLSIYLLLSNIRI